MTHLTHDELALLLDAPDAAAAAEMNAQRAHLRECSACAELLKREAALDEEVDQLADLLHFCPGCTRPLADDVATRCAFCGVAFAPGGLRVDEVLAESDHGRLYLARGAEGPVALKEIVFARVPDVDAL